MLDLLIILTFVNLFIFLLGVAIGRSIVTLKIRKEENRKLQLEEKINKARLKLIKEGKKTAVNLEDLLYKLRVKDEIEKITGKKDNQ